MPKNKDYSINKAEAFLVEKIMLGMWKEGEKLPALRHLAKTIHVSLESMCCAVRRLASRKVLTVVARSGTFVGQVQKEIIPNDSYKWQRVRTRLESDILNRKFLPGQRLPPLNELKKLYGICFYSLKKAINSLVEESVIKVCSGGYIVPNLERKNYSTILLISLGEKSGNLALINERFFEFLSTFEVLAIESGINFDLMGFGPDLPHVHPSDVRKKKNYIGYLVWSVGIPRPMLLELIEEIRNIKKPLAIIDEIGDLNLPKSLFSPFIRVFTIAGFTAGHKIGKYLLGMGHRSIAYLSNIHDTVWSQQRFLGLCDYYEKAGVCAGVKLYSRSYSELLLVEPSEQIKPLKLALINKLRSAANSFPHDHFIHFHLDMVHKAISGLIMVENQRLLLQNLFKEALENSEITAWVAANDILAILAIDFLRVYHIDVPKRISIVGFDNIPQAHTYGLTSYNFVFSSITRRAFDFIINPSNMLFKKHSVIECEGVLIKRCSSGAAPRKL